MRKQKDAENNDMKQKLSAFMLATFASLFLHATAPLTVSDVAVTPITPFGLAIDYTVGDVQSDAKGYAPEVTLSVGESTYTAKTLSGDTSITEGSHRIYWNLAKDGIASFEGGTVSVTYKEAPYCVIDLSEGASAIDYPVTYLAAEPEGGFNTEEYKKTKLVLKRVAAGSFIMGEDQKNTDHEVTLTQSFYMGLFEVTQEQWVRVMGSNPSKFATKGEICPVECVSYYDVRGKTEGAKWPTSNAVDEGSFLGTLRQKTGLDFDLPTEAQWEYTCRAGTQTKWSFGDDESVAGDYMWYKENAGITYQVGRKQANPWGFYDMHGNVLEMCVDWYAEELTYGTDPKGASSKDGQCVWRGGSWGNTADDCSSAFRHGQGCTARFTGVGLRLARTLPSGNPEVVPASAASTLSADILPQGSEIDGTLVIDCAQIAGAEVSVKVNGEAVDVSSGTYKWLPNKVTGNVIEYTINDNTFTVTYNAVERTPTLTAVVVTNVVPFGLAIDYTYTIMEGATTDYKPLVTATTRDGATTYLAKTLTDPIPLSTSENKYRVYWNMAKDGVGSLSNVKINVTLREVLGELPEYYVIDLSNGSSAAEYGVSSLDLDNGTTVAETFNTDDYKKTKLVLKRVDPGSFNWVVNNSGTSRTVALTQPFYMGLFEVTQNQWELVTGGNPSWFKPTSEEDKKKPVEQISYDAVRGSSSGKGWPGSNAVDAESFLGKMRARTGLALDLPTEAQWEYTCRAGTTTKWSFGDDASLVGDYMWYSSNSSDKTYEVGTKKPNPWGFYDMHGNVFEWCLDWMCKTPENGVFLQYGNDPKGWEYGENRVRRGGSFRSEADSCSSATRASYAPSSGILTSGLRLALPVSQKASNTITCNNVTTSVIVEGTTLTDSLTLEALPSPLNAATVTADGETVVEAETVRTSAAYRPTANGIHIIEHVVGDAVMSVAYNFCLVPLTVSEITVQKVEPFGLVIDYTVDNVIAGATAFMPEVTLTLADGTTKTAATLSGDTDATAGAHRLYWNLAADGIASFEGATVSVTYKEKDSILIDEPTTVTGDGAVYCVIDLKGGTDAESYPLTFLNAEPKGGFNTEEYKTTKLVLKRVMAGSFNMGDNQTASRYKVTLSMPFYMGLFEVTQKQWELVMGTNPSSFTTDGAKKPVEKVTYDAIRGTSEGASWPSNNKVDASSFLGKLRARTGLNFDLPTEAQWEYACRAGTTTTYSYGNSANGDYMWYNSNSSSQTHEVGTKSANPWGFYDMHGNVFEWCLDWNATSPTCGIDPVGADSSTYRVVRGGSWNLNAASCASSTRVPNEPSAAQNYIGFRLSRVLQVPFSTVEPTKQTGVAVNILTSGSKIDDTVTINCAQIDGATVKVTVDGAEVTPGEDGTYAWLPNKVGVHTIVYSVDGNDFTVTYDAVERPPVITAVEVQNVAPFGIAIDYTYTIMEGATMDYKPFITATTSDGLTLYMAKTLTDPIPLSTSEKKYRVYWNMVKDGVPTLENAAISVMLGEELLDYCVVNLEGGTTATQYDVSYLNLDSGTTAADTFNTTEYKMTKLVLKRVDPGSFIMGADQTNKNHRVALTQPFYMALFETTQNQWELVTGTNPSYNKLEYADSNSPIRPVERASYNAIRGLDKGKNWPQSNEVDETSFLGLLRQKTQVQFDLPTEAQWEYVCRAGTTTTYNLGNALEDLQRAGWYWDNARQTTCVVGGKTPNAWGFYDMHGNVWEWCLDEYNEELAYGINPKGPSSNITDARVLRGGGYNDFALFCTSASRTYRSVTDANAYGYMGFRLAMAIEQRASNVYKVNDVTTSVIADGATVETAINFDYLGAEAASVTIIQTGEGGVGDKTEVVGGATSVGTKSWQPTKPDEYKYEYFVGSELIFSATYTMREIPIALSPETLASFNYTGVYDGAVHGIAITNNCAALKDIKGATVAYTTVEADIQDDKYQSENPTFKKVGVWTVYYRIVADGYAKYRGVATVTISDFVANVAFDALGGKIGAANVVTQKQTTVYTAMPSDPTRENYLFKGWYFDVTNGTTQAKAEGEMFVLGDHTLYALWEVDPAASTAILSYTDNGDGTVTIAGFATKPTSKVSLVIPDIIEGKPVTAIAEKAFVGSENITSVTLPIFLQRIGRRAFHNATSLKEVNIPGVRKWEYPSESGTLTIGELAFANTLLGEVYLPEEVTEIGNKAFNACQKLATVTILGAPSVGEEVFYNAGLAESKSPTLRLAPDLAANEAYLSKLTTNFGRANLPAAVRTDAVVESVAPEGISIASDGSIELPVSIGLASTWGEVDTSRVRVEYSESLESLTKEPSQLSYKIDENKDGTFLISVTPPEKKSSGFFRVKILK